MVGIMVGKMYKINFVMKNKKLAFFEGVSAGILMGLKKNEHSTKREKFKGLRKSNFS